MKKYFLIGLVCIALCSAAHNACQEGTRILFDEYHANWKPSLQFSKFILTLEREGYISHFSNEKIDSYTLASYNVLVLLTPSKDFESYEKEAIKNFVRNGGTLIIFGEAGWVAKPEGIVAPTNSISTMFGIEFNNDTVIDPERENQIPDTETTMRDEERFVIIRTFDRHPVTYNIFNFGYIEGCSLTVTSPAVGLAFGNATTEAGSRKGREVIVLAAAEYGTGKVVAVGDKDFLVGGSKRFGDHDGFLIYGDNERLGRSIFAWAATEPTERKDRDGDGVPDDSDQCYNPGCSIIDARGCPKDTDADGISDCTDQCPQEAGSSANNGCPTSTATDRPPDTDAPPDTDTDTPKDSDTDGVPDDQDQCYNPECSIVDSLGCPQDTDSDGVNDCVDNCLDQSGPINNNGCPQGLPICAGTLLISILVVLGVIYKFR